MPFVLSLLTESPWEASVSKELAYHINVKS